MLTRKDFWALVKEINWPVNADHYQRDQVKILRRYDEAQIDQLHELLSVLYRDLRGKLWEWELEHTRSFGRTDDGMTDLLHHVIGLGQETYEACKADPGKMKDLKVVESFAYVFPSEDDRKYLDLAYFRAWARRLRKTFWHRHRVREVQQGLNSLSAGHGFELGDKMTKPYNEAADLLVELLDTFIDQKEPLNDTLWRAGVFEMHLKTIDRRRDKLKTTLAHYHLAIKSDHGWPSTTSALNFMHDLVAYHGPAVPPTD